jgi:protein-S-isoprenylcysteine O-methyltransferase Ste14
MPPENLALRLVGKTAVWLAIMGALLFAAAGTVRWMQGWAFLAIFAIASAGFGAWLGRRDPGLLAARLGPITQRGQPLWDKIFLIVFVFVWLGWLFLMGLDAQRWHSSSMPPAINVFGAALMAAGFLGVMRVFRENSFAAPVIRVQSERTQRVIDTGPYALVRHPMYSATMLYLFGISLLLGSWYGLLAVPLMIAAIAPRAVMEERLLKRDLPGYANYMTRVRYRLIPGIW